MAGVGTTAAAEHAQLRQFGAQRGVAGPEVLDVAVSSDSAASSSAWLIVEALARSPRTRPFQPSPVVSVVSTCVGCAQLTM